MAITKPTLKGYLLEEALAFLLRNAGYRLLIEPSEDTQSLKKRAHGLVVVGRGGEHQADVLGQLSWMPAFTYPLRLFLEAKFREKRTGIEVVRSAIGIINDLNENYSPMRDTENQILVQRYTYNYAIFSTSGFTKNASDMALAHRISLIDLSGDEYKPLLKAIDYTAQKIIDTQVGRNFDEEKFPKKLVVFIRYYLREQLGLGINQSITERQNLIFSLTGVFDDFIDQVKQIGELFIGVANGPFLLIIKSDQPKKFRDLARKSQYMNVRINWIEENDNEVKGIIYYSDNEFSLTFAFPKILKEYILNSDDSINAAFDIKNRFFSSITIYSFYEGKDEIFRLKYDNRNIQ